MSTLHAVLDDEVVFFILQMAFNSRKKKTRLTHKSSSSVKKNLSLAGPSLEKVTLLSLKIANIGACLTGLSNLCLTEIHV